MASFRRAGFLATRVRCSFGTMPSGREPLLFTPGPLTTSISVKQEMLVDLGSRDPQFISLVREVRQELLKLANTSQEDGYECVLVPGSGTTTVESVFSSAVPRQGGRVLVVSNGAYGDRIATMLGYYGIDHHVLRSHEARAVDPDAVADTLAREGGDDGGDGGRFTHVAVIHHETTAGTLNDIATIGSKVKAYDEATTFVVDSMSGFGCYEVDLEGSNIHYLVSSANKNIEGVPGFGFAICNRAKLQAECAAGNPRSLSLDLLQQWEGLEVNGQFRFTPPVHALLAFRRALLELEEEGGVAARRRRYESNAVALAKGLADIGLHRYVVGDTAGSDTEGGTPAQGCIIHTYLYPDDENFNFPQFYDRLASLGIVIYPGKLTQADCFRVGSIGRMFEKDMLHLVSSVKTALTEQGVSVPVTQIHAP